ncbi:2Fe-2S iron-sulfur cluster-binding protein [Candidatus Albibeggiatoa sp. nov. NOAA]|uniref:2Fe-2S iron-sulfur cluster-binding protein n=1 Tax=Candidatus Albibeggiatoa sp. nov. NOAA TaxID=3162724 RepID=UPI0032F56CA8|nr:2Fe-2S iron-sulfur cluster-binding protein [Thiotrichaceae bacterium]
MAQLLSVSRAARLVGTTRGTLQHKIRNGEITTFEGKVKVTDLLRAYPQASLEDNTTLERMQTIKAEARPRRHYEETLPSPEVLTNRLTELAKQLICTRNELQHQHDFNQQLLDKLSQLMEQNPELQTLYKWVQQQTQPYQCEATPKNQLLAKDTFLRIMAAHVKMLPSGHEFFVEGSSSLLEAALQAGLALNYGCSSGNCGACKARVVSGEVWKVREHDYVLSEAEKNMGYMLMCSHTAVTDLVLEASEAHHANEIPEQEIQVRVKKLDSLSDDIVLLQLQTPRTQTLRFMAGQCVKLSIEEGKSAKFALASCPCDGRNLQFHIRKQNNATAKFIQQLNIQQPIMLEGPKGEFVLGEDDSRPAVFIAYADGFAPIKSLVEHAISIDIIESFHFFWVCQQQEGHYLSNLCRSWADALDNFHYHPLIIQDNIAETTINKVLAECPNIEDYQVYVAGIPNLTETSKQLLQHSGLADEQMHIGQFEGGCIS